jgi:EAL domain-containing protein (putative c-di-GMP-specific phosphodiesterase class I)
MQFYSPEMNAGALQQMTLENSLRQALEQEEFHIHYQPLYDLKSNRVVGAEALLRWKHPEMDMVSPTLFIELAEESGVIVPIGEWMMMRICRQLQAWQTAGLRTVPISVNLTQQQFKQPDLAQQIETLLKENNINPFFLEIEITENTLTENLGAADQIIRKLKKSGIRVNVDDFGTGHSSLAHLKRFHIDKLKIDPSFIANLLDNADDSAIVRGMISMAHSMRMEVVAEGVETQKQLDFLKALNCDQIQGFFYNAALPAEAFATLLDGTESAA